MKMAGIGFIGSGFAKKVQAPCFSAIKGAKLIGASSPRNAAAFASSFGMPFHSPDWKELIRHPEVELVCITSPPYLHCEQTLFALEHGKHVICEKPFAMNLDEAEKMLQTTGEKKLLAVIDHELRLSPVFKRAKRMIQEGMIGKIYFASAVSHISGRRSSTFPYNWWYDKSKGGGAWGAIGSHLIDTLRFFCGDIQEGYPVISTAVSERTDAAGKRHEATSDETGVCSLKFASGATGYAFTSTVANDNRFDVEITGEKGSLKIDMNDNLWFASDGKPYEKTELNLSADEKERIQLHEKANITARSMFSRAFIHFADAVIKTLLEGKIKVDGAATFNDGFEVQKLMDKGWGN